MNDLQPEKPPVLTPPIILPPEVSELIRGQHYAAVIGFHIPGEVFTVSLLPQIEGQDGKLSRDLDGEEIHTTGKTPEEALATAATAADRLIE